MPMISIPVLSSSIHSRIVPGLCEVELHACALASVGGGGEFLGAHCADRLVAGALPLSP